MAWMYRMDGMGAMEGGVRGECGRGGREWCFTGMYRMDRINRILLRVWDLGAERRCHGQAPRNGNRMILSRPGPLRAAGGAGV